MKTIPKLCMLLSALIIGAIFVSAAPASAEQRVHFFTPTSDDLVFNDAADYGNYQSYDNQIYIPGPVSGQQYIIDTVRFAVDVNSYIGDNQGGGLVTALAVAYVEDQYGNNIRTLDPITIVEVSEATNPSGKILTMNFFQHTETERTLQPGEYLRIEILINDYVYGLTPVYFDAWYNSAGILAQVIGTIKGQQQSGYFFTRSPRYIYLNDTPDATATESPFVYLDAPPPGKAIYMDSIEVAIADNISSNNLYGIIHLGQNGTERTFIVPASLKSPANPQAQGKAVLLSLRNSGMSPIYMTSNDWLYIELARHNPSNNTYSPLLFLNYYFHQVNRHGSTFYRGVDPIPSLGTYYIPLFHITGNLIDE